MDNPLEFYYVPSNIQPAVYSVCVVVVSRWSNAIIWVLRAFEVISSIILLDETGIFNSSIHVGKIIVPNETINV